jgi:hypothetical protein
MREALDALIQLAAYRHSTPAIRKPRSTKSLYYPTRDEVAGGGRGFEPSVPPRLKQVRDRGMIAPQRRQVVAHRAAGDAAVVAAVEVRRQGHVRTAGFFPEPGLPRPIRAGLGLLPAAQQQINFLLTPDERRLSRAQGLKAAYRAAFAQDPPGALRLAKATGSCSIRRPRRSAAKTGCGRGPTRARHGAARFADGTRARDRGLRHQQQMAFGLPDKRARAARQGSWLARPGDKVEALNAGLQTSFADEREPGRIRDGDGARQFTVGSREGSSTARSRHSVMSASPM